MTSPQNNTTLQDAELLRERIKTLLHEKPVIVGRSRQLTPAPDGEVYPAFLAAIRETQRPCKLVLRNDRQEELALEVASGRVLQICASTSNRLMANAGSPPRETGEAPDPSYLGQLAQSFCRNSSMLSVETLPAASDTPAIELGVDIDNLPTQDDAPLAPPSQDNFVSFLQACEGIATSALLLCGDQAVFHYGHDTEQEALMKIAQSERDFARQSESADSKTSCVIFCGHPIDGSGLLCQTSGDLLSLLCFKSHALQPLLGLRDTHFGGALSGAIGHR